MEIVLDRGVPPNCSCTGGCFGAILFQSLAAPSSLVIAVVALVVFVAAVVAALV